MTEPSPGDRRTARAHAAAVSRQASASSRQADAWERIATALERIADVLDPPDSGPAEGERRDR
jgi:hypothetical protein